MATADQADITIEVLGRGARDTGMATTYPGTRYNPGAKTYQNTVAALTVRLSSGAYSTDLTGSSTRAVGAVWRDAANAVASQIDRWVKDNHALLLKQRMTPSGAPH